MKLRRSRITSCWRNNQLVAHVARHIPRESAVRSSFYLSRKIAPHTFYVCVAAVPTSNVSGECVADIIVIPPESFYAQNRMVAACACIVLRCTVENVVKCFFLWITHQNVLLKILYAACRSDDDLCAQSWQRVQNKLHIKIELQYAL